MFAIASVWIGIVTLSQQVVNSLTEVYPVYMLTSFR
jgi:5'(3')-deoxyribonucleotidase